MERMKIISHCTWNINRDKNNFKSTKYTFLVENENSLNEIHFSWSENSLEMLKIKFQLTGEIINEVE